MWDSLSYLPANDGVMALVCGFGETNPEVEWLDDEVRGVDDGWYCCCCACCWNYNDIIH